MTMTMTMLNLFEPSESINFSFAQKKELGFEQNTLANYTDVVRVVNSLLSELNVPHLLDDFADIEILTYSYEFITHEEAGNTVVYSFAVLDGRRGDRLDDKVIVDPNSFGVIQDHYILPMDAPFIVLGYVNKNNPKYLVSSIAHEVSHILVEYAEDNEDLLSGLSDMIPNNIKAIPVDEALAIMFEIKVLQRLFDGGEIMQYLIDRYLINGGTNEQNDVYIKDLRALVAVAS